MKLRCDDVPGAGADRGASAGTGTLRVRVNDELVIDAGRWGEVADSQGEPGRIVHPPARTMFEQVIDYLSTRSGPPACPELRTGEEAVAVTATCLRWGTYLAFLTDRHKRPWSQARQPGLSRIHDSEMARISIEASAALEQWVELMRNDPDRYRRLAHAAARHLPMTLRSTRTAAEPPHLLALACPGVAARIAAAVQPRSLERARAEAQAHPTRVLANGMINFCWRSGPIEDIHAGQASTYPLMRRRITPSEERALMRATSSRLAQGILALLALLQEKSERSWSQRVLAFHLVPYWMVTPMDWSLEERTCSVRLPGGEPGSTSEG